MKKIIFCIFLIFASPITFAQETKGMIEQIQVCGTGEGTNKWIRTLQFKINGMWFAIYADYYGASGQDYDNNISTSMLFMAYSQNLEVHINATDSWVASFQKCGQTSGAVFQNNSGDFIRLSR